MIVAFGFKFVVVRSPISGVLDMPGNATEQVSRVHLRKECCLKNKSSAQQAMLLVQRYLDQCKEAAIQQATARIQKCLKRHMMSKFSQAAGVTPPNLVSDSSSDGEIGFLASRDYETKRHHCIRCHYCNYWWDAALHARMLSCMDTSPMAVRTTTLVSCTRQSKDTHPRRIQRWKSLNRSPRQRRSKHESRLSEA